jgi:hypothetical protein
MDDFEREKRQKSGLDTFSRQLSPFRLLAVIAIGWTRRLTVGGKVRIWIDPARSSPLAGRPARQRNLANVALVRAVVASRTQTSLTTRRDGPPSPSSFVPQERQPDGLFQTVHVVKWFGADRLRVNG